MARAVVPVTWRLDPKLFERIQAAARARHMSVQAFASEALERAVGADRHTPDPAYPGVSRGPATDEDTTWLNDDLSRLAEVEPYDWGREGVPRTRPIAFVPGVGFVVGPRP